MTHNLLWLARFWKLLLVSLVVTGVVGLANSPSYAQDKLNVNAADAKALRKLPGVGKVTAARILEHLAANGPCEDPHDLLKVKGIGRKTLAKFEDQIVCGEGGAQKTGDTAEPEHKPRVAKREAPVRKKGESDVIDLREEPKSDGPRKRRAAPDTPTGVGGKIDINKATAKEFQMLKGIGKTKAQAIVDDRDKNGPFASVNDLARVRGIGRATVAKNANLIFAE